MEVVNNWTGKSKADKIFTVGEWVKDIGIYGITTGVVKSLVCVTNPIMGLTTFVGTAAIAAWLQKETSDAMIDETNELSEAFGFSPDLITKEKWRK